MNFYISSTSIPIIFWQYSFREELILPSLCNSRFLFPENLASPKKIRFIH